MLERRPYRKGTDMQTLVLLVLFLFAFTDAIDPLRETDDEICSREKVCLMNWRDTVRSYYSTNGRDGAIRKAQSWIQDRISSEDPLRRIKLLDFGYGETVDESNYYSYAWASYSTEGEC